MGLFTKSSDIKKLSIQAASKINIYFTNEKVSLKNAFSTNNDLKIKYSISGDRLILDLEYNDKIKNLYLSLPNLEEILFFRSACVIDILNAEKPLNKIIVERSDVSINFLLKENFSLSVLENASLSIYTAAVKNLSIAKKNHSTITIEKGFVYNAEVISNKTELDYDCLFYNFSLQDEKEQNNLNVINLSNLNMDFIKMRLQYMDYKKIEFLTTVDELFFQKYLNLILKQSKYLKLFDIDDVKLKFLDFYKKEYDIMFSYIKENIEENGNEIESMINNPDNFCIDDLLFAETKAIYNEFHVVFSMCNLKDVDKNYKETPEEISLIKKAKYLKERCAVIKDIIESKKEDAKSISKIKKLNSCFYEMLNNDFPTSLITKNNQQFYREAILQNLDKIKDLKDEQFSKIDKVCYLLDIKHKDTVKVFRF